MRRPLSAHGLRRENLAFRGTNGVSPENRSIGFIPAFLDAETGRVELARFANGRLAPIHLLEGLPLDWIVGRSADGCVTEAKPSIVAGFVRAGRFFTREQAAAGA